jgi:hypothetical protein
MTPTNRKYLAVPVLAGILFSHFDYSTRFDETNLSLLFDEVFTLLKTKGYKAHELLCALHLFARRRNVPDRITFWLYQRWKSL